MRDTTNSGAYQRWKLLVSKRKKNTPTCLVSLLSWDDLSSRDVYARYRTAELVVAREFTRGPGKFDLGVAHPTDEGGYPVRQLPPLMLSSVAAVEQPQPPPTAPTPTDPKLISNSSKRKGIGGEGMKIHLPFPVMSVGGSGGRPRRRRRKTKEIEEGEREKDDTKSGGSEEKEQYRSVAPIPIEMAPDRNTPCTRHTIYTPGPPYTCVFDFLFFPRCSDDAEVRRRYADTYTRNYAFASHSRDAISSDVDDLLIPCDGQRPILFFF
ncbi:hypothetical protein ALC62_06093 [Cyphomyrmex costatus]|uniref:Uncharacterized protein n=1 Tax=Cyphomyrmex costatus TaxID=456900 RepID=A0A195CSB0_9HYME|nr:hypothetical protein ALC62_06093 [Cyphomyrmex costatus]